MGRVFNGKKYYLMKIFLSYILDENTPSYGNRDAFTIDENSQIINGVGANTSSWAFTNNHIGTHMDTPFHFFNDGKKTEDYMAEEFCFYKIFLLEKNCTRGDLINLSNKELGLIPIDIDFLIIKTGFAKFRELDKYHNDNPGLQASLADKLRKRFSNLKCIGFDFISLTSWNHREHGRLSHKSFLGNPGNFLIVEDMDLNNVDIKTQFKSLILAPLRTSDGNGGPVTIIADINEK